jgi:hypothetical protein
MTQEPEHIPSFSEKLMNKLIHYRKPIFTLLGITLVLSVALSFFLKNQHKQKHDSYISFTEKIHELEKFKTADNLHDSIALFKKLPNQQNHDQNFLIQISLSLKEQNELQKLQTSTTNPLQDFPFYKEYSSISLLIAQDKLQEAAGQSLGLHQKMHNKQKDSKEVFGLVLYSYNLLRIAFLHEKLQNPSIELDAWKDLEDVLYSKDKILESTYTTVNDRNALNNSLSKVFAKKDINLKDYIQNRKQALSKKS